MLKNTALVSWMILIKSETAYILQAPIKIGCLVATWSLSLEGKPLLYIFPAIIYSYSNVTKWHKQKLIILFLRQSSCLSNKVMNSNKKYTEHS